MSIFRKVLKDIINIITFLIVILIILAIYYIIQINIQGKEYANVLGYTIFEIKTGSMAGTIEINDIILVKISKDVHEKDIISYSEEGNVITHRIIQENGDTLVTKGDANNTEDKPINRNQVIGKMVIIFSGIGIWMKVLSNWKVIFCVMTTLMFLGLAIANKEDNNEARKRKHSIWIGVRKLKDSLFKREE